MNIKLERPLAFFDIEATGTSPRGDRIVELAIIRLYPDGKQDQRVFRVNPERPIPDEAVNIHGISNDDIKDAPLFADIADEVLHLLQGCDLAGYNIARYDIPMLTEEFLRAGKKFDTSNCMIVDAQHIFFKKEPRDLSAALSFYCGEEHSDAHGAVADVIATMKVLEAQIQRYPDVPHTVSALAEFCSPRRPGWVDQAGRLLWKSGKIVLNFGRKKGTPLEEVIANDPGFIDWMLRSDFPQDTREIISAARRGQWPDAPEDNDSN